MLHARCTFQLVLPLCYNSIALEHKAFAFTHFLIYLIRQCNLTNLHANKIVQNLIALQVVRDKMLLRCGGEWEQMWASMRECVHVHVCCTFAIISKEWKAIDELSSFASVSPNAWIVVELNEARGNSKSSISSPVYMFHGPLVTVIIPKIRRQDYIFNSTFVRTKQKS